MGRQWVLRDGQPRLLSLCIRARGGEVLGEDQARHVREGFGRVSRPSIAVFLNDMLCTRPRYAFPEAAAQHFVEALGVVRSKAQGAVEMRRVFEFLDHPPCACPAVS